MRMRVILWGLVLVALACEAQVSGGNGGREAPGGS
jgi:hypothetical protein